MTSDERDIHGQDRQEIEVEGCNTQFWWGVAQRNLLGREQSIYKKLLFAGYLRDDSYLLSSSRVIHIVSCRERYFGENASSLALHKW
jgi:hypothetical protein